MSNTDNLFECIDKAKEIVPKVYEDTIQPAAHETGKAIGRIPRLLNALLADVDIWMMKREANIEAVGLLIEKELDGIKDNKIVSPQPYIALPALQAISCSMDSSELRTMYAKLLAKSMNQDTKDFVHPSFVDIIKQMSPLDAKLLKVISAYQSTIPLVQYKAYYKSGGYIPIKTNVNNLIPYESSESLDDTIFSLANFNRLGLLEINYLINMNDENNYLYATSLPFYQSLQPALQKDPEFNYIDITKGIGELTPFGSSFIQTCIL